MFSLIHALTSTAVFAKSTAAKIEAGTFNKITWFIYMQLLIHGLTEVRGLQNPFSKDVPDSNYNTPGSQSKLEQNTPPRQIGKLHF